MELESLINDLGENAVASRRLRQSMPNLLSNTNATRNDTHRSNVEISSTFYFVKNATQENFNLAIIHTITHFF